MDGPAIGSNFSLREEIKAYWSQRAATFDQSPGHEIFSEDERAAWHRLIVKHLGKGKGRTALDLASGTGVVSLLMDDLGFNVTGMDWAEPMLERARDKAKGRNITFRLGDAESTMEPDNHYDVIVNRHLVWTLVDPAAAFAEWLRILKPGGCILIVDGDFVNSTPLERFIQKLSNLSRRLGFAHPETMQLSQQLMKTHQSILSRVHFSGGARAEAVAELLRKAGFQNIIIDTDMRRIHRAQARHLGLWKGLARGTQHRYAIKAIKL
ncbi:SAM-dependent methyltransferase [Phyllobacterium phragmitis]|uniref:SAM-dependent methyltransferase n=1 Tax=Phyllobacterium phragmitis TaxID=2670329 RepID=A0A2S9IQY5_9HYPH|nr:class I SAM-dependent methyltransferase [Phyllobacterium phragmitis]PRD42933.1 SAM-dependent methyltransferase [Phyllobacterium phragmitis]